MSFKSKKLPKNNLGFLKGATLFFLGTSVVLFMANAFEIVPSVPNAIQYIANIVLTQEGTNTSTTGVILQGSGGHAWFKGDVSIASLPSKACLGTDSNGKITEWTCWAGGSDTKVGTGEEGKRCIFTGDKIVCDQNMPIGITGAVWPEGPQWPVWATGAVWPEGPQWPAWATWASADTIFSGGEEGKRCILENGKIECTQDTPAGGTWAQPAGEVNNIQFKAAGDVWSGSDWLVWKNNKLGIGIDNPTTDLQIFDYAYIGRDVLMSTWGNFLKILGSAPHTFGEVYTYTPNIQLNYQYYTSVSTFIDFNWQIKNNSNFLQFNFGTGGEFAPKVAIWSGGSLGIGTTTPTEKFQIEDYIWMGKNTSVKTWGSFLRMYGLDLGNPALNDKPNVQLNYRTISYSFPSGEAINNDNNRQIKNNKDLLEFNFSTGGDYTTKLAVWSTSGVYVDGNMNVTSGKIGLGYDTNESTFSTYPNNSMFISEKLVLGQPLLEWSEITNTTLHLIVNGAMKLQAGYSSSCSTINDVGTIIMTQSGSYHVMACLGTVWGPYEWKQLDN